MFIFSGHSFIFTHVPPIDTIESTNGGVVSVLMLYNYFKMFMIIRQPNYRRFALAYDGWTRETLRLNPNTYFFFPAVHYLGIVAAEGEYHHIHINRILTIFCSSSLTYSEDLRVLGVSTEVLDRVIGVQHGESSPLQCDSFQNSKYLGHVCRHVRNCEHTCERDWRFVSFPPNLFCLPPSSFNDWCIRGWMECQYHVRVINVLRARYVGS